MRLECLQSLILESWGSERQSVKNIEPRQSETRNSLLVDGCELIVVRGWGNAITYAVGCSREDGDGVSSMGEARAEEISKVGCKSQTIIILSSRSIRFR